MKRAATLAGWGAVAATAVLLTISCPPADLGWLGWIALVPYFWVLLRGAGGGTDHASDVAGSRSQSAPNAQLSRLAAGRQAWKYGFALGFLQLFLLVPWFAAFTPLGYPLAAAYWGLLTGAISALVVAVMRRLGLRWAPPVLAAGWTVLEWLRAQGLLAFPWGTLAATQHRHLEVLQLLDLTGAYGLTFLMALFAASLAGAMRGSGPFTEEMRAGSGLRAGGPVVEPPDDTPLDGADTRGRQGSRASSSLLPRARSCPLPVHLVWGFGALGVAALAAGRGAWILHSPPPAAPTARVAVVQASRSYQQGVAVYCDSPPAEYDRWTRAALEQGADLVVWPESASVADALHDWNVRARMTALLAGTGAHLLTGSFVQDPASGQDTNAAVMLAPTGEPSGSYAKVLIVPFGEYLPARPLLRWTEALGMPRSDLRAGTGWSPLAWDRGSIGVSICFESGFGHVSRSMVNRGANLLAILTSDGWAGRKAAGLQHLAFAPLRAVETRRSVARAAATGVSELIDPYGRTLRSIPMFERGVAVADLPLRRDRTLYSFLGDWPVWLAWGILVLGVVSGMRRVKREP